MEDEKITGHQFKDLLLGGIEKYFQWLEWMTLMGIIGYFAKTTQNPILLYLFVNSFIIIIIWTYCVFSSPDWGKIIPLKSEKHKKRLAVALTFIVTIFMSLIFIIGSINLMEHK